MQASLYQENIVRIKKKYFYCNNGLDDSWDRVKRNIQNGLQGACVSEDKCEIIKKKYLNPHTDTEYFINYMHKIILHIIFLKAKT